MIDEAPPGWLDADVDVAEWDQDEDQRAIDTARAQFDEQRAADQLRELEHLTGEPVETNGRSHRETIRRVAGEHRASTLAAAGYPDLDAFLHEPEPEYEWCVPGLLERGDRIIVTGQEGKGKSTLLRQIGVQVASGLNPFTLAPIAPQRVVYVDLENGRRHVRRELRKLRLSAGERLTPGFFTPVVWPSGIDLLNDEDRATFIELTDLLTPDLLIVGPLYKLAAGDPKDEETARGVALLIDEIRTRHGCAFLLEAHQPYAVNGHRALRPYGASLWSRWPEFGLHLGDTGLVEHWRGARDERDWPTLLTRGGDWPWTATEETRAVTFARVIEVTTDAGRKLSLRELEDATGGSRSTISRSIKANKRQYDDLLLDLGDRPEGPDDHA